MGIQRVESEGAELAYDVEGTGPLLIAIAGRGGTGGRYAGVSARLQDQYRVVHYDRRCCGRSTGDRARPMDLTQQARDVLAIMRALGEDRAFVFGNSAGASIAVRLAEYYPEALLGVVAHEPMIVSILPDRDYWIKNNRHVDRVFRTEGVGPAMALLAAGMVGMERPAGAPAPARADEDMGFFLDNEVMSLSYYQPDLDRIQRSGVNLLASKGERSREAYYARTADVIGDALGRPARTMSGNHIAHVLDPSGFAEELRALLAELTQAMPASIRTDNPGVHDVHR